MIDMIKVVLATVLSLFGRRASLEAENVVLRHRLNILRRSAPHLSLLNTSSAAEILVFSTESG